MTGRADGCADDTCRNAWRLAVYIWLNLWTVLPGTVAVAVLILLRQSTYLAESCPSPTSVHVAADLRVNPLFCPDATLIGTILQAPLRDIGEALKPPPTPGQNMADAAARIQARAQAAIFREARARLRWIASYAAVVVFAIGGIFAGLWITFASLDDHLFPEDRALGEKRWHRVFAGLCLLTIASGGYFIEAWAAIYQESRTRLFAGLPPDSPFDIRLLRFQDAMTSFIFGDGHTGAGHFLPVAQPMLERANWLILLAILALACAVSATLYQRPFQVVPLDKPRDPAEVSIALKDATDPKPTPQKPYDRVLVRCFQRLNICIYIGATLLVICVINISARYGWIVSLLDPTEGEDAWKTALPNAINGLAEELALQYGLGFTTLLLGLLIPTWIILRRRAWVVARLRNPGRDDMKSLQDFLASNGMGFTSVQQYAQVLAVLAPAGAGIFVTALKALTGATG
jgi:hypothetical protein